MSWHIGMYDRLRSERLIEPGEHGSLPVPLDVAHAMERCADRLENEAKVSGNLVPVGVSELRWLATKIRNGTPAGRDAFWNTLLAVVEIKRVTRPPGIVTRYLAAEMLAPFGSPPVDTNEACEDFIG